MPRIISRRGASLAACIALFAAPLWAIPAEAATNVSDEATLRTALSAGEDVTLTRDITLTTPIELPDAYTGTIDGAGFTVVGSLDNATNSSQGMIIIKGNTTVKNLTIDGASTWRPFWVSEGATLNLLTGTTVTRGNSNAVLRDGGAVMVASNATLNMDGSTISESVGFDLPAGTEEDLNHGAGNGGAIATRSNATITGKNCTFINNHTSHSDASNGGAIFVSSNSKLSLDKCTFSGNSARNITDLANQGGAIYASLDTNTTVSNSTFTIAKGFNTGGAIRSFGGSLSVTDSTFIIDKLGDAYAISGGAIALEGTRATIERSTFKVLGNATDAEMSKVIHAGGFITVVDSHPIPDDVEHSLIIRDSTFTGNGSFWQSRSIATFGGAIAFETGDGLPNYSKALIEGSTFTNITSDQTGGAISMNSRPTDTNTGKTTLILRNSTINNTRSYNGGGFGGGVFVGKGDNHLTIEGGSITDSFAAYGGAIYNAGTTVTTAGAHISRSNAFYAGGGAYNDGALTLGNTTWDGNQVKRDWTCNDCLDGFPTEFPGANIYAKKNVTITPEARLDAKDVRVLDGESAVLLTGPLTQQLNISLSEAPKQGSVPEAHRRYLGYTVAKGTDGYTVTPEDARIVHYVTKDEAAKKSSAPYDDHRSVARWDYIFNPSASSIVLGQRAQLIFHSNEGTFDPSKCELVSHNNGNAETRVRLYYVYSSTAEAYTIDPQNNLVTELAPLETNPCRSDAAFSGWYIAKGPHSGAKNTIAKEQAFNFKQFFGEKNTKVDGKIVDALCKNSLDAYAGWQASVAVTYEYVSRHAANPQAPTFPDSIKAKALLFDKVKDPSRNKDNAPLIGSDVAAETPSPTSEEIEGYRWVFDGWTLEGNPVPSTAITNIQKSHHFVGHWKVMLTKTHAFESATTGKTLPDEVTKLTPGKGDWQEFNTTMTPTDNFVKEVKVSDGTWKFKEWDKPSVANAKTNQHFIGKWEFEALPTIPVTFVVEHCAWADGSTDNIVKQVSMTRQGDTISGLLGDVIPAGMKPITGYQGGAWKDPAPAFDTVITEPTTFTYACTRIMLKADHEFTSATAGQPLPKVIVDATPADFIFEYGSDIKPGSFIDDLAKTIILPEGTWTFQGWDKDSVKAAVENQHFVGQWAYSPLTPVTVTYKVEHCLWSDGSTDDKVVQIPVKNIADSARGILGDTIPVGMKPAPGYEGGQWNAPIKPMTVIEKDTTYTYSCTPVPPQPEPHPKPVPPPANPKTPKILASTGSNAVSLALGITALLGFGAVGVTIRRSRS